MKKTIKKMLRNHGVNQFLVLTMLALVLVSAQRISAVTTWSDPTEAPPGGSIVSPVTIGVSSSTVQIVNGKLSMDTLGVFGSAFIEGFLAVGTTSGPSTDELGLVVDGNVGATQYCDVDGNNCYEPSDVVSMLTDTDDGVVCPTSPNYSSMNRGPMDTYFNQPQYGEFGYYGASSLGSTLGYTASENRWDIVTMPASCKTDGGCIIRQKIYKKYTDPVMGSGWYEDRLYAVRDIEYRQEVSPTGASAEQLWVSSYRAGGGVKNGDTTTSNVIKPFSYLYLRDDANVEAGETDNDKFSAYDYTRSYGFEIYFCSEAAI